EGRTQVALPTAVAGEAQELKRERDALALLVVVTADRRGGVPLRPQQDLAVAELQVAAAVERVRRRAALALDLDAAPVAVLLDLDEFDDLGNLEGVEAAFDFGALELRRFVHKHPSWRPAGVTALVERQAPGHDTAHLSPAQEWVLALDGHVVRLVGDELEPGTVGIDVPGKRIDVLERR